MKKTTCLLIAILFAYIAKSQNTCLDAKRFTNGANDTIPAVGSISPAGPDLGCLTTTGRQLWYYIPVCHTVFAMSLTVYAGTTSSNDSIGEVFYGPFAQKVSNCSDLNAGKIMGCISQSTNGPIPLYITDSLYEGNYYYLLVTFSDSITGPIAGTQLNLMGGYYNCYECNNQVSVIYKNNLCMVTVDTAINKCVLTWEEFSGDNLMGYNIYRETTLTGVYDSITTIPVGSMSTYTDMTSSPAQHNVTYTVMGVDSCGQSYSPQSSTSVLTSIHLISFAGGNNQANLIWNNIFSGSFIPQYYIYRNNNGSGWQVIDSIGITLQTITYTDIFAPAGNNQYTVELRKLVPCVPMRMTSTPFQSVFSNTSLTTVTGTEEFVNNSSIKIYPNPVYDYLSIYSNFASAKEITITLFNLYGQELKAMYTGKATAGRQEHKFSLKELPSGIYFVKMKVGGKEEVKKVVKQ